jgi:hypothetical protein
VSSQARSIVVACTRSDTRTVRSIFWASAGLNSFVAAMPTAALAPAAAAPAAPSPEYMSSIVTVASAPNETCPEVSIVSAPVWRSYDVIALSKPTYVNNGVSV